MVDPFTKLLISSKKGRSSKKMISYESALIAYKKIDSEKSY